MAEGDTRKTGPPPRDGRWSGGSPSTRLRSSDSGRSYQRGHHDLHTQTYRGQGGGGSGFHRGMQKGHTSLESLKDQLQTDRHQALLSVVKPQFGLQDYFEQENMPHEMMRVLLELLCNCLEVRLPQSCVCLLTMMHRSHVFIQSMASFVLMAAPCETDLLHLISICQRSLQYIPEHSVANTTVLLSQINAVITKDFSLQGDLTKKLSEVEEMKTLHMKHRKVAITASTYNAEDDLEPEENFRSLSVTPTLADLLSDELPFLRKIKRTGGYKSVEHYLDVHFRLLREDFISPLREGIQELLKSREMTSQASLVNQGDIRLYKNVYINMPLGGNRDVVFMLTFDASSLGGVKWEDSKRFTPGTLLCLSADNFKTVVFATVYERDANQLKRGRLLVELDWWTEFNHDAEYEMVESTVYFEAYKHTLNRIKEIHDLPFKEYLLQAEVDDVMPPKYLRKPGASLILAGEEFPALKVAKWPTNEALELNESQYRAFQNALTNEVSIIQGPPGTGKTYLGLKIMDALLENKSAWRKANNGCILIVCYTNHALDQFLEGVIQHCNLKPGELIRIGGKSKSAELQEFNITARRKCVVRDRYVGKSIYLKRCEQSELKERIAELYHVLAVSKAALRPIYKLVSVMTEEQHASMNRFGYKIRCVVTSWLLMEDEQLRTTPNTTSFWNYNEWSEIPEELFHQERPKKDQKEDLYDVADKQERMIQEVVEMTHPDEDEIDGFQVKHRNQRKKVKWLLRSISQRHWPDMGDEEFKSIKNVWALDQQARLRLYRSWLRMLNEPSEKDLRNVCAQYNSLSEEIGEYYSIYDEVILKKALVVGMTTTGAAKQKAIMRQLDPTITIIEEAAELLEAQVVSILSSKCQQLILIGDHQQLRPSTAVYRLARNFNLDVSLFERFVKNGMCCSQLNLQHRMRPEIARLLTPHIYKELYNHGSVLNRDDIKGINGNVFFINHQELETKVEDTMSHCNDYEATFIVRLLRYLLAQGYQASQMTVLTMYRGQMILIKKKMSAFKEKDLVRVSPVDDFQGEENDIILLSCVRSNVDDKIGFLNVSNRICVALSRAREGFYCIGNISLLRKVNPLWEKISSDLEEEGCVVDGLPCFCPIHSDTKFVAKIPTDFEQAPRGGCKLPCSFRLKCGHTCEWLCHPHDKQHKEYLCMKPCTKSCPKGHPCTSVCYRTCPPCGMLETKIIPKCQHEQMVPCYMSLDEFICQSPCERQQGCGHSCEKPCGSNCSPCKKLVLKALPQCVHQQMVPCHQDVSILECTASCQRDKPCGHPCEKICSERCPEKCTVLVPSRQWPCGHKLSLSCWQTPENTKCTTQVTKKLLCGHQEQVECGEDLEKIACRFKMTVQCSTIASHTYSTTCGGDRVCSSQCEHILKCEHKCPGECGLCSDDIHSACSQRCTQVLLCGHLCQGKCSEWPCPPCEMNCEGGCRHSPCFSSCGSPCFWCFKQCEWSCEHLKCDLLCWEPCERHPCNEPCPKHLHCGHQCLGLCGEECPLLCKVCGSDLHKQITQEKPDEALVMLSPCHHMFPVQELDDHFKPRWLSGNRQEVQMPVCPTCKHQVKACNRYNSVIKQAALDWNRIKMMSTLKENMSVHIKDELRWRSLDKYLEIRVQELRKIRPKCESLQTILLNRTMHDKTEKLYRISSGQVDIVKEVLFLLRQPEDDINEASRWVKCPFDHIQFADPNSTTECSDCRSEKTKSLQEAIRPKILVRRSHRVLHSYNWLKPFGYSFSS